MTHSIQQRKQSGFTIIEVLIVLAIAGLIMLVVFLAVPALQRNARNNTRNSEGSRIASQVTECLANRNGQNASCMSNATLGITPGTDTRELLTITYQNGGATAPASSTTAAGVWHNAICAVDGASATATGSSTRDFAVVYTLEPAVTRCIDSQ